MIETHPVDHSVVLIVEDEPLIRLLVIELFEDEGFEALEAASADEALAILVERYDVALLFTDVEMPGSLDGYALARWVHAHRPAMKTIIVSGRAMPRAGDIPPGASFVGKPYDHDDLIRHAHAIIAA